MQSDLTDFGSMLGVREGLFWTERILITAMTFLVHMRSHDLD